MRRRARTALFLVAAVVLAAVLVDGLAGLPAFGHFHGVDGRTLDHVTVRQRHATDVVTAVNFDYRGLDTMGEEFILFASSVGLVVLLREQRADRQQCPDDAGGASGDDGRDPLLALVGRWSVAPIIVLGVYVVTHGQLTPGGGFQGGVVLASALITLLITTGGRTPRTIRRHGALEALEGIGAGGYVVIGVAGIFAGLQFLSNFLPLGTAGALFSSGTVISLSTVVGLEVAGAIALIVAEFAEHGQTPGVGS
ncbi:MAG TPA: MnhB domain-containing protein [Solirubrobacteraceae bacterium]|nr:MnhB domain-containing protein [Solirubrobacteraceae bacterium]